MKCRTVCKWLGLLGLAVLVSFSTWVAWDNWGRFLIENTPSAITSAPAQPTTATLARGEYLAHVGGCIACHTAKDGAPLAGGRRIDTPYGAVFSSNLTPDKQYGLGQWRAQDFWMALHWGRSRNGHVLLPVFPYNHTSVFTPDDVQALFSWLQTVQAVETPQPEHRLTWPLGTQPVIAVWRSLFFTPSNFQTQAEQSADWNRGAYLIQGAGHCAACHGQRNALGSFPAVDDVSGGFLDAQMWVAPSLTDSRQTSLNHSHATDIAALLRAGQSPYASVSGPMAEFVQNASQYLTKQDAQAMATYLKLNMQTRARDADVRTTTASASSSISGEAIYQKHCTTCHGNNGQGKTSTYPALAGNPAVTLTRPDNLIQMVLYGGYGPSTQERPRPYGMPPYLFSLNNQQIADVLNHIRSQWGNQANTVSPMQVDRVRSAAY
jgi:mono/diheme cytochrome c family protein